MQILNQTFLVTGGGSGLGAATARMLIANGGNVVIADINAEQGNKLAAELGPQARFAQTNVSDEASVQAAVDACVQGFGGLHGAINCAGIACAERMVGKRFSQVVESIPLELLRKWEADQDEVVAP